MNIISRKDNRAGHSTMLKPKALRPGDTIGLVAPSGAVRSEHGVERAVAYLQNMGYQVKAGESCGQIYGYLSGTDEIRARDVNRMFLDPEVDAVFCLKGGYGTPRILDRLDYEAIKAHPKLFVGYSDITAMHIAFHQLCNLVTLHGPMGASDMIEDTYNDFSRLNLEKAITSTESLGLLKNPDGDAPITVVPGRAEGLICGGNLTLIALTIGTPYELDTRGKILLIEEIGEHTYEVDGLLNQLRLAGKFADCAGIIFGDFTDCTNEYPEFGLTVEEIIRDLVMPAGKPAIRDFRAGHGPNKITVPLGVRAQLDADVCTVLVTESALI